MIRVSDALHDIIQKNQTLQFGLAEELFNLSQLAKYLVPAIKARTKKELQPSAVVMALSRYQKREKKRRAQPRFEIKKLSTNSGLVVSSFLKTRSIHRAVNDFYSKVQESGGSLTITEGTSEVTVIYDEEFLSLRKRTIRDTPVEERTGVGSLSVRFDRAYLETPGFIYLVLQQLYFQNLNVVELSSTATEMVLFLAEEDVRLAFDTLFSKFRSR